MTSRRLTASSASIERFGRRFLERVFTPDEIRYCESKANKAERYAGRFAAKEAAMKAIGTGWSRGRHLAGCRGDKRFRADARR